LCVPTPAKKGYDDGVKPSCAKSPAVNKMWLFAAAVAAIDGLTSLTNWSNFARHDAAHGWTSLCMAAVWFTFAFGYPSSRKTQ
jgi:hypothetical protein